MTQDPTKSPAVSERDEIAPVQQRHRDAAADWCLSQPFPSKQVEAPMIRAGDYDHHSLVQAFAHFEARLAPAPEKGVREALNGCRAAVSFIGADSWDGCSDCIDILKAARAADVDWEWAGDSNRIAQELARIRPYTPRAALAQPEAARVGEGIPAGMKPWMGGDRAPEDWNGKHVLLSTGAMIVVVETSIGWQKGRSRADIIAYTPKTPAPRNANETGQDEALREAERLVAILRIAQQYSDQHGEDMIRAANMLERLATQPAAGSEG